MGLELELRYKKIQERLEKLSDFPEEELARSRNLFHLDTAQIIPRNFEVWTCLVGLPLPTRLTSRFQTIFNRITALIPSDTRFYEVIPQNYHWELFIIKRPDEDVKHEALQKVPEILSRILCNQPSFTILYRGFLITPDGTIIVKGYGDFDELRSQLCKEIPFASLQQSSLGHVSLGRILDPVGSQCFTELKSLIQNSENEFYGDLKVSEVKYVYERQWYMEERDVVAALPFKLFHV